MTAVCSVYIMVAPEGFSLSTNIAYPVGAAIVIGISSLFLISLKDKKIKN